MWTTCFAAKLRAGAIESTIAIGPSNGIEVVDPDLLEQLAAQARRRATRPSSTPPPGSSQYSLPGFSCRQSRMRSRQRRSADTRMRGSAVTQWPGGAEAAVPALACRQLVDLAQLGLRHGDDDELGDPHARLDHERLVPVGVVQDHTQLAPVAGVDEARRVDDRDPVLRGEARARRDQAGMPFRDRDRDARSDERALAGRRARGARTRRGRDRRRRGRPSSARRRRPEAASRGSRSRGGRRAAVSGPRPGTGEAAHVPLREPRPDQDPVLAVGPRLDRRPERVQLRQLAPLGVRDEQLDRLEAMLEALGDPCAQLVRAPRPSAAETCSDVRKAVREAAARAGRRPRRSCSGRARSATRARRSPPARR